MPAKAKAKKTAARKPAAGKSPKYVYLFGRQTDGNGSMKPLLGGKGANLAEMCRIGLPVPPGFTITTEVCTYYYANKRTYPPALQPRWKPASPRSRRRSGMKFGDLENPLLVSVRSGARDSMPGMMDTILNLGLNDEHGRRPGPQDRQRRASRGTATAASSRCTATSSSACRSAPARTTSPSKPSSAASSRSATATPTSRTPS